MAEKRSKRTYPKRKCPFCKELYIPADSRQVYCCRQHQINFNNDRYKKREAPIREQYLLLKQNAAILKKIKERLEQLGLDNVTKDLLVYEGFQREIFDHLNYSQITKQPIYWSLGYGLESKDSKSEIFIIHGPAN